MISAQKLGTYCSWERLLTRLTTIFATLLGFVQSGPLAKDSVIGVSTKPGLISSTCTPFLLKRWDNP